MSLKLAKIDLKQKLNKRETIIFIATLLVSCLGFFKVFALPGQKAITDAKQQIQTLENERKQLAAKSVGKTAPEPKKKQWLSSADAVEEALDALVRPTYMKGVKVISMQLAESKTEKAFTKRSAILTVSGNFTAVGRYLEDLENLPAPFVIETISMAVDGTKSSDVVTKIQGGFYESN